MKIIFVCTGNTCRSPMAEGIMRKHAPHIETGSRGILVCQGTRTARHTVRILKEKLGVELNQHARQIRDTDCRESDFILTMTRDQADFIRNLGNCSCVFPLTEFAGDSGDIPDPYGGDRDDYEKTFSRLEELILKVVRRLDDGDVPDCACSLDRDEDPESAAEDA